MKRRRVPIGELFSLDPNRKPLQGPALDLDRLRGPQPGLWDGTGTWQPIGGGFELLKDRLGIWINVPNPNGWNIRRPEVGGAPYPAGVVKGVEDQANAGREALHAAPDLRHRGRPRPRGDGRPAAVEPDVLRDHAAGRRPRPLRQARRRRRQRVQPDSEPVVVRDDSHDALAEADARRLAGEAGEVAGVVTIPRFTQAYRIGDRIRSIQGRDLSLRTNAGRPDRGGRGLPGGRRV